ncbi:hypothetical protein C2S53_007215 [Perilla frutescens var. hirtella]|uniref:Calponin-homology (CH) domain-containing protein n=1 Tax=Perilla frutescens var. hirtella TaxID=608512 RepID=A0AAD4JEI6_PERFH|nr:hypothetical protein C2S53_007215 [Perilla frutescens var. hirtella]
MIESSPPPSSSAESSFRELDEVFLQTQTRLWLGELLNTRLDEDLPLPDLLQDGEILFQVSKVVWDLLMTKCMELRHLKHKYGPFGSKKSSGRYRPYSNVDSFLKVCKILGLSGIDLFSPSDVVEKKNIRKVCICIRALSKKARSKQLSAPDFDMVIYSVTMPTDMVGVIRRSLESPQCTVSSSSSYSSRKGSKVKLKQKNVHASNNRDDDSSSSDESDEAESRYMGDGVNFDLEDSPEKYLIQSDVNCQCTEEFKHGHCKSASDIDHASSCCSISKKKPFHGISHVNSEERQTYMNGDADVSDMNFTLENDDPFTGDSSCINVGENNYIANYLAFSDLMVHATDVSSSVVLDGEKNMFDFFLNVEPQGVTTDERSFHNGSQRIQSDDEDMEVSSTTSMSSVLGRLLNLEFDNQFDEDDSSSTNLDSSISLELESKKLYKDSYASSEPPKDDTFHDQIFDSQEAGSKMAPGVLSSAEECSKDESCGTETSTPGNDFCLEGRGVVVANDDPLSPLSCADEDKEARGTIILGSDAHMIQEGRSDRKSVENVAPPQLVSDDTNALDSILRPNLRETVSDNTLCEPIEDMNTAQEDSCVQDDGGQESKDASDSRPPSTKHYRRPLLKTVVKGTAIAGIIFLLLQIRKSNGNSTQERQQNARYSRSKPSSEKQQRRSAGKGIYPTEKIKLGN